MSSSPHRSFETIIDADLVRLAELALGDFQRLFASGAKSAVFRDGLRLLCLCQGAARHWVDLDRGVQDFDVWGFFEARADMAFPPRRRGKVDFGLSRFGANPDDVGFVGRRVDVVGRSLPIEAAGLKPIEAVRRWLGDGRTASARCLAARPVVIVWPDAQRGQVIWAGEPGQGWPGEEPSA